MITDDKIFYLRREGERYGMGDGYPRHPRQRSTYQSGRCATKLRRGIGAEATLLSGELHLIVVMLY